MASLLFEPARCCQVGAAAPPRNHRSVATAARRRRRGQRVRRLAAAAAGAAELSAAFAVKLARRVPRVVHQIWIDAAGRPPPAATRTCRELYTTGEWKYYLWDECSLLRLLPRFPLAELFYSSTGRDSAFRSDILRYSILDAFGGVYLDADTVCLRRVDGLLEALEPRPAEGGPDSSGAGAECFAPSTLEEVGPAGNRNHFFAGYIGCVANSSFMRGVVAGVPARLASTRGEPGWRRLAGLYLAAAAAEATAAAGGGGRAVLAALPRRLFIPDDEDAAARFVRSRALRLFPGSGDDGGFGPELLTELRKSFPEAFNYELWAHRSFTWDYEPLYPLHQLRMQLTSASGDLLAGSQRGPLQQRSQREAFRGCQQYLLLVTHQEDDIALVGGLLLSCASAEAETQAGPRCVRWHVASLFGAQDGRTGEAPATRRARFACALRGANGALRGAGSGRDGGASCSITSELWDDLAASSAAERDLRRLRQLLLAAPWAAVAVTPGLAGSNASGVASAVSSSSVGSALRRLLGDEVFVLSTAGGDTVSCEAPSRRLRPELSPPSILAPLGGRKASPIALRRFLELSLGPASGGAASASSLRRGRAVCAVQSPLRRSTARCWRGMLTKNFCCDQRRNGTFGNPLCWRRRGQLAFERCCGAKLSRPDGGAPNLARPIGRRHGR
eukprot:TRINITY_DN39927_c0_g1_i1.p1 TRINITY_DN39927_c0_g1~~TRINITY_DN39927_c0_g1_i1.p1  ORF type:complete len:673 (+),score=149.17 TRINITY_DN39927_c0_g1_i1:38-2056(+)